VTAFIRDKAQIAEDSIMEAHIRMFVTDFSYDMGTAGERAIQTLLRVAQEL
jgi:1,4-dihydroxy-6-naphthoate synthase